MGQKNELSYLLKSIKKVTIESLPNIIEMVPGYGSLMSKILSKILSVKGGYDDKKSEDNIQEQLNLLNEAIQNRIITEEYLSNEIQKEITNYLKATEKRLPVYMSGIIIYAYDDYNIDEEEIKDIFLYEYDSDDEKYQNSIDTIHNFYDYMDTFYTNSNCLIMNFMDSYTHIRNDDEILDFIEALNYVLQDTFFVEYTVF
ncbi:MAG: hypothetical protein ACI4I6_06265 [Hominimerdicola sp.]